MSEGAPTPLSGTARCAHPSHPPAPKPQSTTPAREIRLCHQSSCILERAAGIEPAPQPWKGRALPLRHARTPAAGAPLSRHHPTRAPAFVPKPRTPVTIVRPCESLPSSPSPAPAVEASPGTPSASIPRSGPPRPRPTRSGPLVKSPSVLADVTRHGIDPRRPAKPPPATSTSNTSWISPSPHARKFPGLVPTAETVHDSSRKPFLSTTVARPHP